MCAEDVGGIAGIAEAASEPVAVAENIGGIGIGVEKAPVAVTAVASELELEVVIVAEPAAPAVASEQIASGTGCLLVRCLA